MRGGAGREWGVGGRSGSGGWGGADIEHVPRRSITRLAAQKVFVNPGTTILPAAEAEYTNGMSSF